ncbi:thioredoxin family protein [bacterium]|nr:thioredoxin family protein [bacterium]MBP3847724.1 thioredoxin family protein [bacterium]
MIIELNEKNFDKEIETGLKVVEFYATWCSYCMKQRMELQEFEKSQIRIGIIDGDESPDIISRYKISGYPTFIIFKDGNKIDEFSGFHTKSELLNRLMKYV